MEQPRDRYLPSDPEQDQQFTLELYNDDFHSFDFVIDSLVEICQMDPIQATQCTYFIHYKGKYAIRKGSRESLLPLRRALHARELKATVR